MRRSKTTTKDRISEAKLPRHNPNFSSILLSVAMCFSSWSCTNLTVCSYASIDVQHPRGWLTEIDFPCRIPWIPYAADSFAQEKRPTTQQRPPDNVFRSLICCLFAPQWRTISRLNYTVLFFLYWFACKATTVEMSRPVRCSRTACPVL